MSVYQRLTEFAKAARKLTKMALRLVDKLFSQEILMRSTVYGTKDFAPLDVNVITAIKSKLTESFTSKFTCMSNNINVRLSYILTCHAILA